MNELWLKKYEQNTVWQQRNEIHFNVNIDLTPLWLVVVCLLHSDSPVDRSHHTANKFDGGQLTIQTGTHFGCILHCHLFAQLRCTRSTMVMVKSEDAQQWQQQDNDTLAHLYFKGHQGNCGARVVFSQNICHIKSPHLSLPGVSDVQLHLFSWSNIELKHVYNTRKPHCSLQTRKKHLPNYDFSNLKYYFVYDNTCLHFTGAFQNWLFPLGTFLFILPICAIPKRIETHTWKRNTNTILRQIITQRTTNRWRRRLKWGEGCNCFCFSTRMFGQVSLLRLCLTLILNLLPNQTHCGNQMPSIPHPPKGIVQFANNWIL